jgi:hypothetical protein
MLSASFAISLANTIIPKCSRDRNNVFMESELQSLAISWNLPFAIDTGMGLTAYVLRKM